jgi:pimeloyl-ACP methyl ester carboxylesterase
MPVLQRPDGEIHYQEYGQGFPILLFATGGLRSRMEMWHSPAGTPAKSWNDWTQVLADKYRVIAMDQRNAGASRAAIKADHGWHTYAADHLTLMDHLGIGKFHTLGGCIGGSFCLKLAELVPDRVAAQVLQNPIGLDPEHPEYFPNSHAEWSREQIAARPELDAADLRAFGENMWGGDFAYSVGRDFVRSCKTPSLLLPGDDIPHPACTSDELKALLPGLEVIYPWKGPAHLDAQLHGVRAFLARHTPAR